tara:strand:- start:1077 stop:1466 length:390 start_codon:yes stop_codon:yes gene_type:complete
MASELRVNTLKDAAGNNSIATSFVAGGSAKAWANFTSNTTTAYRDSFNFSTITDVGTGITTHTFSTAMNNNDYAVTSAVSAIETGTGSYGGYEHCRDYTTSSFKHYTATGAGSLVDRPLNNNSVNGDLA